MGEAEQGLFNQITFQPYLFGHLAVLVVIVSKPAISALAPRVEAAIFKDAGTVGRTTRSVHHFLTLQGLHQLRAVSIAAVSDEETLKT